MPTKAKSKAKKKTAKKAASKSRTIKHPPSTGKKLATTRKRMEPRHNDDLLFLSTGSTLLNLALSDRIDGGFVAGTMANVVGDSSSGKTILAHTVAAELSVNPKTKDYHYDFDDVEAANLFDMTGLFGQQTADRLREIEHYDDEGEGFGASDTIQSWSKNVHHSLDREEPFFYNLDSFDALTSREELAMAKKAAKEKKKAETSEDSSKEKAKGSYKMEKPKLAGELLRRIIRRLENSQSFLWITSQTRDKINAGLFESKKTRSGGRALKFYATHELWLACSGKIEKTARGIKRQVGTRASIKVTKNKVTGKVRTVDIIIYYDYGIDDMESCVEFLVKTGEGKRSKAGTIVLDEFELSGRMAEIKLQIEERGLEQSIREKVGEIWADIEATVAVSKDRKPKYA